MWRHLAESQDEQTTGVERGGRGSPDEGPGTLALGQERTWHVAGIRGRRPLLIRNSVDKASQGFISFVVFPTTARQAGKGEACEPVRSHTHEAPLQETQAASLTLERTMKYLYLFCPQPRQPETADELVPSVTCTLPQPEALQLSPSCSRESPGPPMCRRQSPQVLFAPSSSSRWA